MVYLFFWNFAALAAAIYCIIKAVTDVRGNKYLWGIFGIASAAVILLTPIQTHAVKVDLPVREM